MDGTKTDMRRYRAVRRAPTPLPANRRFATRSDDPDELTDPIVFDTNDLATPLPPPEKPDYLLRDSVKDNDIEVSFVLPAKADYVDTVQLLLNGSRVGTPVFCKPFIDQGLDLVKLPLTAADRKNQPDGKVEINYEFFWASGSLTYEKGPPGQFYTTDFAIPGLPYLAELDFSEEVEANGVTPSAMQVGADGKEYLEALVASYSEFSKYDTVHGRIGNAEEQLDAEPDNNGGFTVRFLREFIEANEDSDGDGKPDGSLSFSYQVQKRSGIKSAVSHEKVLGVFLQDAFNPPPPHIPAYEDDSTSPKLIDEADARQEGGLTVEIPADTRYVALDEIYVMWGTYGEIGPVTVSDPQAVPVARVGIPYKAISESWEAVTNGADTVQSVAVSYVVRRGGMEAGAPLQPTTVEVNLHKAGGEDPKPETPENDNLGKPTFFSASGKPNEIPAEDFERPAKLTVPWSVIDPPDTPAFAVGDTLVGLYGQVVFAEYPITTVPAADIDLDVGTDVILPGGSGPKNVSYMILRPLAAGGENASLSPEQAITVHGNDELPGGGRLGAGSLPEAEGVLPAQPDRLIIGKTQAVGGTDFVIPVYANQQTTDTITVSMEVFRFFYDPPQGGTPGHPADKEPQEARDVLKEDINPTSTGAPTIVHFTQEELMRYDLPELPLHAHLVYTVTSEARPDTTVTSDVLLTELDPRGD